MSPSERWERSRRVRETLRVPRQDMLKQMVGTAFLRVLTADSDGDVVALVMSEVERMSVEKGFDPIKVADMMMEGK